MLDDYNPFIQFLRGAAMFVFIIGAVIGCLEFTRDKY